MNRHYILLAFVVVCLSSCDKAESSEVTAPTVVEERQYAMEFEWTADNTTRATDLHGLHDLFGVWTYKRPHEGGTQTVMDGYDVAYTEGRGWHYGDLAGQHLKYWDEAADNYMFVGVAPYPKSQVEAAGGECLRITGIEGHFVHSLAEATALGTDADITTTATRTTADADFVNWLVARTQRTMTAGSDDIDALTATNEAVLQTPSAPTASVPLRFHTLLTQVEFRILCDEGLSEDLELQELKVTTGNKVVTQAIYDETLGAAALGGDSYLNTDLTAATGDDAIDFTVTNLVLDKARNSKATSLSIATFVELPQAFASGLVLKADVTSKNGSLRSTSQRVMGNWAAGRRYVYYLKIGDHEEIIMVDVDVTKWRWREGNDIDVEDPMNNW